MHVRQQFDHYWKTSFAHFTGEPGAESSSLGGWPENEIQTALRISFPLLDVDIDRKKDGAEMGLHEHFLGEAHAMLFIKTTRIMRRLWRGGIRRSCSNVWFIDGYYLRGFRLSMLSPASTSHQEVTRALFSWWDRDSILSPIALPIPPGGNPRGLKDVAFLGGRAKPQPISEREAGSERVHGWANGRDPGKVPLALIKLGWFSYKGRSRL